MSLILEVFVTFVIAFLVTNLTEWVTHKYILHDLGKKKNSPFHHHYDHHKIANKNGNCDVNYKNPFSKNSWKEVLWLAIGLLFNLNWLFFWPMLFYWFCFFSIAYYVVHAYSHTNVKWGKKYLPHHYDHHQGLNQDLNWCVTVPFFDWVFGTRVKYEYDSDGKVIRPEK